MIISGTRVAAILLSQAKSWAKEQGASELIINGTHRHTTRQVFLISKGAEIIGANVVVRL